MFAIMSTSTYKRSEKCKKRFAECQMGRVYLKWKLNNDLFAMRIHTMEDVSVVIGRYFGAKCLFLRSREKQRTGRATSRNSKQHAVRSTSQEPTCQFSIIAESPSFNSTVVLKPPSSWMTAGVCSSCFRKGATVSAIMA